MKIKKFLLFVCYSMVILLLSAKPNDPQQIDAGDHLVPDSKKALDFWTRSRAYPQKDIPAEKYYNAFQREKMVKINAKTNSIDQGSWKEMGPYNVAGRMLSIAVNPLDPEIILAGSASGGLWRTDNVSTMPDWKRIPTGFPVLDKF